MPETFQSPGILQGNIQASIRSFAARGGFFNGLNPAVVGRIWYVNANTDESRGPVGYDGNDGRSPLTPLATMERAFEFIDSYDTIVLSGVIREQLTAPLGVFDVTIVGSANQPRQATDSGVPTGGGSSWLPPTTPTALTPLLTLREQGWKLVNFQMAPTTNSACVRLNTAEDGVNPSAGHAQFLGMYLVGAGVTGGIGIEDNGGAGFVTIDNCRFQLLAGTAILGLSTAIAVPLGWRVSNNLFLQNTNSIAMSSAQGLFINNVFNQAANDANNKVNLVAVAAQGSLNQVLYNVFSDAAANVTIAKGYKPGTTDIWRNYVTDQAAYIVAVPA